MKPITFVQRIFLLLAVTCTGASLFAAEKKRPNVILIMTDNHGAWTLGCYGNPDIRTPNIDRLAAEGTLFTRAFASNPVCSPTRATCLTGLVPSQHGVHSFLSGGRLQIGPDARCTLDEFTSLPEVLRDQGYACGLVGKWHLGGNLHPQEGFDDYWITMPHGGTSTFYDAQVIQNGELKKEPKYLTDLWTEHAVKFIDQRAKEEKPFFLFLAYNGPYALSRLLLRDGRNRHAEYYADKEIASFPRTKVHPWQLNNRDFINNPTSIRRVATEVSGVDDGVGEVLQALKERGLDEDTVVIFVADQGWVGGQGGFFGMGDHTRPLTARDGMMQIPMIWRHPKSIASGARQDQLVANYDLMPTLLGHLGIGDKMPTEPKSPGRDFSSLLEPKTLAPGTAPLHSKSTTPEASAFGSRDDAVFYEFENLRCVRTATHKYIHRHPNGPHELYDLVTDPEEFVNLVEVPEHTPLRDQLKSKLDEFYAQYSLPKYDMWKGGTSQVRIHDGVDEEVAQRQPVEPPPLPDGFEPAPIDVPEGFVAELVAGPPLVTHPTMGCFDDQGRLYVCNNAGTNMTNDELEANLPNSIRQLVDQDGDGRFDSFHVFADKMTFPMGGVWHEGSLYVASPPNIWRLTDTDDDGVANEREIIVTQFGYNGNAASIHGCFFGPDGRLYWTDGYHGHEFKDDDGGVTSKREGSYIFSCLPDGSDKRIHCGGGMDNPVEVDFTDSGDMLGTVNILFTRPRVDALVHWLHGGAYPHRQRVLDEIKITGPLLGPAHRFGHVAVSGMTRYRSGVLDHRWGDDLFVTFFNSGKLVRVSMERQGSTYTATQHEFLSSPSREFHPTDVLEDADGSLLVVDTGGWFYRGCPTSQFAKPDLLGGIYRIRRQGMTTMVDPRGQRIAWKTKTPSQLVQLFNDTRFAVRQRAVNEAARRGSETLPTLKIMVVRGDIRVRKNCVAALARLVQQPALSVAASSSLEAALGDARPEIRQAACRALGFGVATQASTQLTSLLDDSDAGVRRQAATTLGMIGDASAVVPLVQSLQRGSIDRSEEHAIIYALIELADPKTVRQSIVKLNLLEDPDHAKAARGVLMALDQMDGGDLVFAEVKAGLESPNASLCQTAADIAVRHGEWKSELASVLRTWFDEGITERRATVAATLLAATIDDENVAQVVGKRLSEGNSLERSLVSTAIAKANGLKAHTSWIEPLRRQLADQDGQVVGEAMDVITKLSGDTFFAGLRTIADDPLRPVKLRMDALSILVLQSGAVDEKEFTQLIELYVDSGSPTAASRAAQILGAARLSSSQLTQITPLLRKASPAELRELTRGFQRRLDPPLAEAFLSSIESADALESLAEYELSDIFKNFPRESLPAANRLLDRLKQHQQQKLLRLETLRSMIHTGDPQRGREVFVSEKAKCSSCHRVGKVGNRVGPDLTTIGSNRSTNDLLESIVFPSASIVRDYESHKVLTVDGRALSGLVVSETATAIELQQASGDRVVLQHDDIELLEPSAVSIMPAGLDEAITEQQLLDVVSYLQGLRSP